MISDKDISSWKITFQWSNHTPKVEGHGSILNPYVEDEISGSLVSLTNEIGQVKYLFIADEPVLDNDFTLSDNDFMLSGDRFLFHEGVFEDENAYGRCWFISITNREGNTIRTNNGGVFTKCDYPKGLVV